MKKKETAKTTEAAEAPLVEKKASKNNTKKIVIKDELPVWDLSQFFSGIEDPAIDVTKKKILDNINNMAEDRSEIPKMKVFEILTFVRTYEETVNLAISLRNFASLNLCTQRNNQEALLFEKKTQEFLEKAFAGLSWVHHALYELKPEKKLEILESAKLKPYQEWLLYQLLLPPALSEAVTKAVNKMSALSNGWHSLYREMTAKMNFTIGKKKYTLDEISEMAHSHKDKATRDKALKCMSDEFKRHGYIFTQTLNSIYKDEDITTKVRLSEEHETELLLDALDLDGFGNGLAREDVMAIATAVTDSYVPISQRFYKLLAKLQGNKNFQYNDRLQNPIVVNERKIPWSECIQLVLNTLVEFNQAMAMSGINIIEANIIHAKPMVGKDTGAFCIQGDKPYIFLNYRESMTDVLTFAHEFGHGIHNLYSNDTAGLLNNSTPITMAEVASIFNEKLIFNKWLSNQELSNNEKLNLLVEDVNRQIADIHRQIAFSKFELRAFRECQKGELSEEHFTQIYCEEMERYLGIPLQDDAKFGWMSIPHVFNSPFYVRYYAFAGLVVNKLWQVYASGRIKDFADRYLDMLSNTGLESIEDLLDPFDLDISAPDFWSSALDPIVAEIDEIEKLAKVEGLI